MAEALFSGAAESAGVCGGAVPRYVDLGAVARHLSATAPASGGFRTLVTSEWGSAAVAETACALACAIGSCITS